ncbi:ankyrin repeat domain-containing protein [bacterium]|nr:ankyrin repeat domain-containing protein [bacterium]
MKHLLLTTIAAVLLVGCGESQQSAPSPETKPVEPVAEAAKPEPPTGKAPHISIHEAAEDGNLEAVKQHLAAGTDVNAKDVDGWTPLHNAASGGHKEIAELLIANGADMNANSDNGGTPLDWAIKKKHAEIADLLRKHGGKTAKELKAEGK